MYRFFKTVMYVRDRQPIASYGNPPLVCIDGMRVEGVDLPSLDGFPLEDIESIEILKADAAVAGYGEAPAGAILVSLKEGASLQRLLSGPVPDDYVLGPGDQVALILTGAVELTQEMIVTREGFVVVPQLGRIRAAGLTVAQLRIFLRDPLANSYSGITRGTVSVDVTITRLRTIQVFLTGEVGQPGAYQLASVATVANALDAAGGPTELGDLREIEVRRRSGDDVTLELYPYRPESLRLEQGDVVFVPRR